jgi:hypothetical protein
MPEGDHDDARSAATTPADVVAASSATLRAGLALSTMSLEELWLAQFGLGGRLTVGELEEVLRGTRPAQRMEHDVIAQALNDHFTDRGQDHPVAYHDELHG